MLPNNVSARVKHHSHKIKIKKKIQSVFSDTLDVGQFEFDSTLVDWIPNESFTTTDNLVRYGLTKSLELQIGGSSYTFNQGFSDMKVGFKKTISSNNFDIHFTPSIIVPTGSQDVTEGKVKFTIESGVSYNINALDELYINEFYISNYMISNIGFAHSWNSKFNSSIDFYHQSDIHGLSTSLNLNYDPNDSIEWTFGFTRNLHNMPANEFSISFSKSF